MRAMSQGFGSESPRPHAQTAHRPPARYLVLIDDAGAMIARLFTEARQQVAEFDAGTEEVVQMTAGLRAETGAAGAEWDRALGSHSAVERGAARVFTLGV
jgi:hypothetical protein